MASPPSAETLNGLLATALTRHPEPVMLYDNECVLFANESAQRMLGATSVDEIEGVSLDVFLVPELQHVSTERRGYVMRDLVGLNDLALKIRTLDGRIVHLRVNIRPISWRGTTVAMVTLAR